MSCAVSPRQWYVHRDLYAIFWFTDLIRALMARAAQSHVLQIPSGKYSEASRPACLNFARHSEFWARLNSLRYRAQKLSWQRGKELNFVLALHDTDYWLAQSHFASLGKTRKPLILATLKFTTEAIKLRLSA